MWKKNTEHRWASLSQSAHVLAAYLEFVYFICTPELIAIYTYAFNNYLYRCLDYPIRDQRIRAFQYEKRLIRRTIKTVRLTIILWEKIINARAKQKTHKKRRGRKRTSQLCSLIIIIDVYKNGLIYREINFDRWFSFAWHVSRTECIHTFRRVLNFIFSRTR